MARTLVVLACLAAAAQCVPVALLSKAVEAEAPAHYEFSYSVHDTASGDIKQQHESRQGDAVQGSYSLVQPDGVHRVVDYTADAHSGFNAVVRYEGQPHSAAPAKLLYAAAPVAKIAYAQPAQGVTYSAAPAPKLAYAAAPVAYAAAPVAKLAYASAPVAKVTYAAPATHVSYSSPVISYYH